MRLNMIPALITRFLLYLLLAVTVTAIVAMPFCLEKWIAKWDEFNGAAGYTAFLFAFLALTGACAAWIIIELIGVMRTLSSEPFILRNARALRRMGIAGEAAALLFLIKCFVFITPMTVVCCGALILAGLFALVLSGVFAQAVRYKQENDLTI